MPNVAVNHLVAATISPNPLHTLHVLAAATYGRGAWEILYR